MSKETDQKIMALQCDLEFARFERNKVHSAMTELLKQGSDIPNSLEGEAEQLSKEIHYLENRLQKEKSLLKDLI